MIRTGTIIDGKRVVKVTRGWWPGSLLVDFSDGTWVCLTADEAKQLA